MHMCLAYVSVFFPDVHIYIAGRLGMPTCSSNFELVVLCSTTSRISDPVVLSLSRPPKKKLKFIGYVVHLFAHLK